MDTYIFDWLASEELLSNLVTYQIPSSFMYAKNLAWALKHIIVLVTPQKTSIKELTSYT